MSPSRYGEAVHSGTIVAEGLTKAYRVPLREPGFRGALRGVVAPRYADKVAVDTIDLRVEQGELLALLGPNGAGKSTTIKMLCGILTPTSGVVTVNGIVPHADRVANARRIGVVFGQRSQAARVAPVPASIWFLRRVKSAKGVADKLGMPYLNQRELGRYRTKPTHRAS